MAVVLLTDKSLLFQNNLFIIARYFVGGRDLHQINPTRPPERFLGGTPPRRLGEGWQTLYENSI